MTLLYGVLRASRLLALGLVALWYGANDSTDRFLVSYAVASYAASVATGTFGEALIPHMGSTSWASIGVFGVLAAVLTIFVPLLWEDGVSLAFVPFVLFAVVASSLSGYHAGRHGISRLLLASHAAALAVFVVYAVETRGSGLDGIVLSLTAAEMARCSVLLFTREQPPLRGVFQPRMLWYVLAVALFGVTGPLSRVYALRLGDGQASLLSYALAGVGIVATVLGSGIVVRQGHRLVGMMRAKAHQVAGVFVLPVALPAFIALAGVLALRIPAYVVNSTMLPILIARHHWRFLLLIATAQILVFVAITPLLSATLSVSGIALGLVLIEWSIAGVFYLRVRRA